MRILIFVVGVLINHCAWCQDKVEWNFSIKDVGNLYYEIHFTPSVTAPWHIYSLKEIDATSFPTVFSFDKNPLIILEGGVEEIGSQKDFVQKVKLKKRITTKLSGNVLFMACTGYQCMPPATIPFKIKINGNGK